MLKVKVLILAGGKGSRLWPLSKEKCPKQFVKFLPEGNNLSLFQMTYKRAMKLTENKNIYTITNVNYKNLVLKQIREITDTMATKNIICETVGKNTLPAILYGTKVSCMEKDDCVVVLPSDHKIENEDKMVEIIQESVPLAKENIITFGMTPDKPSTEYGYIEPGGSLSNGYQVLDFKEKPCAEKAQEFINNGYFWNSGMFMFFARIFMKETEKYSPEIFSAVMNYNTIEECYNGFDEGISIDYGVMEKTNKIAVVPMNIGWSDLGGFDAFYTAFISDKNGNICDENVITLDSTNNLVITQNSKMAVLIGVDHVIAVEQNGVLVICKENESYRIKEIVENLKKQNSVLV